MTNHYHLVVETPEKNLSLGMRQLNGVYTQYINRSQRRVGHVFQGRYKAILVEKDSYLLELARYVVLNPVRARMVAEAGDWPWSSYLAMIGAAPVPDWLQTDWLLRQFADLRAEARQGYEDFIRAGVGRPSLWEKLRGQVFLGGEEFIQRMQTQVPPTQQLGEVPRAQRRPLAKPLTQYVSKFPDDRNTAMALAYLSGDYSMKAIAEAFAVHYATVSRAVRAHERAAKGGLK